MIESSPSASLRRTLSLTCEAPAAMSAPAAATAMLDEPRALADLESQPPPPAPPNAEDPPLFSCPPQPFADADSARNNLTRFRGIVRISGPTASRVLVSVAVRTRVFVTVCGLTHSGAIAILARRAIRRAPVRCLHLTCSPLRGRLMLAVRRVAIFRNCRATLASISVGALHRGGRRPGPWVVRLGSACTAVGIRG